MLMLIVPPISCETLRKTEVMFTANPVWPKMVLNVIPRDSPQLTMQKQLNAMTKKSSAVRGSPVVMSFRTAKIKEVTIKKGSSKARYCKKKALKP